MTQAASAPLSEKGFVPTLLLCFFLGALGVHRFYVGKVGTGILMLLTLGGLGIWTLIDFILIAVGSFKDSSGNVIKSS
jgi:TM2 domain-containing membrane protein YozV